MESVQTSVVLEFNEEVFDLAIKRRDMGITTECIFAQAALRAIPEVKEYTWGCGYERVCFYEKDMRTAPFVYVPHTEEESKFLDKLTHAFDLEDYDFVRSHLPFNLTFDRIHQDDNDPRW